MELAYLIFVGSVLFVGFYATLYLLLRPRPSLRRRFRAAKRASRQRISVGKTMESVSRLVKPVGEAVPRSPEEMSKQQRRLAKAGFRRKDSAVIFLGVQATLAFIFFLIALATGLLARNFVLYAGVAIFLGAALPDGWLTLRIRERKNRIERGLPDALDLLVICVEGGMGLEQALMRISTELKKVHKELSDELHFYRSEVNAGRSREDALRNLGARSPVDDLRSLAAVLIQTDRFGTSIAESLRVFSDGLRVKRRQRAEEMAAKMGVKMIPPMVFFVFPSIFVVILGPAVVNIVRDLIPFLGGS